MPELLAPGAVAPLLAAARGAPFDRSGEPARRALRPRAEPYLEAGARDGARELERRREELRLPPGGFAVAMATAVPPEERRRWLARWDEFERGVTRLRESIHEARDARAVAAGAPGAGAFLAAAHPRDPASLIEEFERGVVSPLDDAVGRAARARESRSAYPAELQRPELLPQHAERVPPARLRDIARRLGAAIGFDPDAAGPRLANARSACRGATLDALPGGAVGLVGCWGGPGGLRDALGVLGRAARAAFVTRQRGIDAALWCDPAFGHAAEVLFRRLSLSPAFLRWAGVAAGEDLLADLRLEEALAPRTAWAYLCLAVGPGPPDRQAARRTLRRALAREAAPGELSAVWNADPEGAAELRGTMLGLLIEEKLLQRFGRRWFVERAAGRWIRDAWADDWDETAESLCAGLDVGTMEVAPVLDRCRP